MQAYHTILGNNRYIERQTSKRIIGCYTAVMQDESGSKFELIFGIVLLVAGINGVGTIFPVSDHTVNACYGSDPNCDFYNLQCNSSARILLGRLQYGSKNDSVCRETVQSPNKPGHCVFNDTCCVHKPGDCVKDFTIEDTYKAYYNCSGKEMCNNIQSPWALLETCSASTYSSYVKLQYQCIKDSSIIQLNEEFSGTFNSFFVQFDATRNISISSSSRNYSCEIFQVWNGSNNVTVEVKDVRLSRLVSVNNATNCSSSHLFIGESFQESCNSTAVHDYENFVNGKTLFVDVTTNSPLRIQLEDVFLDGEEDIPAMVWLYIEASSSPINITCNLQSLLPLTTLEYTGTTGTTTLDVTTTKGVIANESSLKTQTSTGTTLDTGDTLHTTSPSGSSDHTNVKENLSSSTTNGRPFTSTEIATTKDLDGISGSTSGNNQTQSSNLYQTQAGNVSRAWLYTGIGIGVGVLIVLVLLGLIIYLKRSPANSYRLHSLTNGYLLHDKRFDDNLSVSRMVSNESSHF